MANVEQPVQCLAIRVYRRNSCEIDTDELVEFLDATAGPHQWLMTAHWLFRAPPIETRPGLITIPVVCPEAAAERLKASRHGQQRVLDSEVIFETELRQWQWVAYQVHPNPGGRGYFPWERVGQDGAPHA